MKEFKTELMLLQKGKRSLSEGIPLGRDTKATKPEPKDSLAATLWAAAQLQGKRSLRDTETRSGNHESFAPTLWFINNNSLGSTRFIACKKDNLPHNQLIIRKYPYGTLIYKRKSK